MSRQRDQYCHSEANAPTQTPTKKLNTSAPGSGVAGRRRRRSEPDTFQRQPQKRSMSEEPEQSTMKPYSEVPKDDSVSPDTKERQADPIFHWIQKGSWPKDYSNPNSHPSSEALRDALVTIAEQKSPLMAEIENLGGLDTPAPILSPSVPIRRLHSDPNRQNSWLEGSSGIDQNESPAEWKSRLEKENRSLEKVLKALWTRNASMDEHARLGQDPSSKDILVVLLGEEYNPMIERAFSNDRG